MKSRREQRESEADSLPDITPELLAELAAIWRHEDNIDQPCRDVLMMATQGYVDAMNPYFESIKTANDDWWQGWNFLLGIFQTLYSVCSDPDNDQYTSIPDLLRIKEIQARFNLDQDLSDWDKMMEEYMDKLDAIRESIMAVQDKINLIKTTTDWRILKALDDIVAVKEEVTQSAPKSGFLAFFRPKTKSKSAELPTIQPDPLPNSDVWKALQEKLLAKFNVEFADKTNAYNDFADQAPRRPDKYRKEWNLIRAKIFHHGLSASRCQTKAVMLHCLRFYLFSLKIYSVIYGESPLSTGVNNRKPPIKKIMDDKDIQAEKTMAKIKLIYQQFFQGMNALMNQLYCLQPDRYEFKDYLGKFNHLPDSDKNAILMGTASEEVLSKIFLVEVSDRKPVISP